MSTQPRRRGVLLLLLSALTCIAFLCGCSLGYTNLRPGENSAVYAALFGDIINTYDEPHWLWVRGTIAGDLNGNGKVDEEVVLATIQKGDEKNPGPIELAFLVACEVSPEGERTTLARKLIFDKNPTADAPKPENDLGIVREQPLTRIRAQMVQDKVTLKETVVVYFWGDEMPSSIYYVGYGLEDEGWVKNFETVMWQSAPGFISANLDRSIDASPFGYQLLFSIAAIPDSIYRKLGTAHEMPLWGHVYARDGEGIYRQADIRFGGHYRQLENNWNQTYLKAVMHELPPEELAWFEYHMAILNKYTRNQDMAVRFFAKARENAKDPALVEAIERAADFVESELPPLEEEREPFY